MAKLLVTIKCKQGVTKKVVIRARKVTTKLLQKNNYRCQSNHSKQQNYDHKKSKSQADKNHDKNKTNQTKSQQSKSKNKRRLRQNKKSDTKSFPV